MLETCDQPRPALVAVIEDDEIGRVALGRVLRIGGYEPALFDSAEAFIASPTAAPLCLIIDVQLGGMSGLDLQTKLRSEGFEAPVVIITSNRADAVRARAQRAGCAAFLWKPVSSEVILALLASIGRQAHT
jgi:FixJ family two-component response regulator